MQITTNRSARRYPDRDPGSEPAGVGDRGAEFAPCARLGHGSIRTTQEIYSHMIHGQDDEAARWWEEFQSRSLSEKWTGVQ